MSKTKIGVPKEIKNNEFRVGATPACVRAYVSDGHEVVVESSAGISAGFVDDEYVRAGATIVHNHDAAFDADMVIKVKELMPSEFDYFHEGKILYTYLHLAACPDLAKSLIKNKVTAVGYETIEGKNGSLPCLEPMSVVAGRLAAQEGARFLAAPTGRGVLLSGLPGVTKGEVVIIGGGNVGTNAAKVAVGMGANVTILDISAKRLTELENLFDGKVHTLFSNEHNISDALMKADLVIGAVLVPGDKAPTVVTREMLQLMKYRSVIVDVAIDQGGCVETAKPTSHSEPIYVEENVVHYCVTNMPSIVSRTSTIALTQATLPYGRELAKSKMTMPNLGLQVLAGKVVNTSVKKALGL